MVASAQKSTPVTLGRAAAQRSFADGPTTAAIDRSAQTTLTPDLCIIGAGSGGLSVAAAAASLGVSVVLIEKHKMGGDCLNSGCVPSKALIAAAKSAQQARASAAFGIEAREPVIDFKQVSRHVQGAISAVAPNDSVARFTALGVKVVQGAARFVDSRTVEAGEVLIRARRFVIATGSSPAMPAIPGLENVPYLTNETVFNLDQPVGHLLVIGGGAMGVELAQAYKRLGAKVTLFEQGQVLGREDAELSAVVVRRLQREGVVIHAGCMVRKIESRAGAIELQFGETAGADIGVQLRGVAGTHLLIAAGRKPNIDGLGLAAAKVQTDAQGIVVNRGLVTSNRRVFAIGDVIGGAQLTHAANYHAGIVIQRALFRLPRKINIAAIPRVTFTDPEIAQTGMTEAEARMTRRKISIYRWPFSENDRARTELSAEGLIKIVCDGRGRILGAGIAGPQAGELIQLWTLAIAQKLKIGAMTQWIAPYPTLGEVSRRAAFAAMAAKARHPAVQMLLSLLRKFG